MSATETKLNVTGMTCGHCVARVTKALGAVPGVTEVKVDPAGPVVVRHDATSAMVAFVAAVAKAGYTATSG